MVWFLSPALSPTDKMPDFQQDNKAQLDNAYETGDWVMDEHIILLLVRNPPTKPQLNILVLFLAD